MMEEQSVVVTSGGDKVSVPLSRISFIQGVEISGSGGRYLRCWVHPQEGDGGMICGMILKKDNKALFRKGILPRHTYGLRLVMKDAPADWRKWRPRVEVF
jgi:hypothetical protein